MEKLKMHTLNMTDDNILKIRELFPSVVTEAKDENGEIKLAVDFDRLKQELSGHIVEGPQERYRLDWPGKREALLTANAPIAKALRPCRDESVDFDTTKNLFIEGDNLDALKLLQETYLGKVKMIYIDPPYNTGSDFVYEDDYSEKTNDFLEKSNQKDDIGNRLVANKDTNGRFHSDWLTMLYPRLKLARNLLSDSGVIFISIGDHEVSNLRNICDEIFGRENFEGHIHWRRRHNQPNDPTKMIGLVAEHILSYAKNKPAFKADGVGKVGLTGSFSNPDDDPRGAWATKPWKVGSDQNGSKYSIELPSGEIQEGEWMGDENTFKNLLQDNRIIFPDGGKGSPRKKYYEYERAQEGQCATNWWTHDQFGHNQEGNAILTDLMDGIKNTFSNPKPPRLIKSLMSIANCKDNDIVLDFFLGSGTTFHSCLQYEKTVHFIGVQLPEKLSEKVKEHRPAIEFCDLNARKKILSEVTKERMRRAIASEGKDGIGFRVLKIDTSNMADVYYRPDEVKQADLLETVSNIKEGRDNPEDLLFQVLLDWGVDLTLPIERKSIQGKDVYFVDQNALAACFDTGVTEELVKEIAKTEPLRVVFKDNGFVSDAVKINVDQVFRQLSPSTEVKSI